MSVHHEHLSPHADAFGHDIVNMATYSFQILQYIKPENIRLPESVVVVGGVTEAFLFSLRCACDAIAAALAYVASTKIGQAPSSSLNGLINWAPKNPNRVRPEVQSLLDREFDWFFNLRSLRDQIAHRSVSATIHCDGYQFTLWMHSHRDGWKTRTPLHPLLANNVSNLLQFSNDVSEIINDICDIPDDRKGSRAVSGILIPNLHDLMEVAVLYNQPSP